MEEWCSGREFQAPPFELAGLTGRVKPPAINGFGVLCFPAAKPGCNSIDPLLKERKAAMLNRATPPERALLGLTCISGFSVTFYYSWLH